MRQPPKQKTLPIRESSCPVFGSTFTVKVIATRGRSVQQDMAPGCRANGPNTPLGSPNTSIAEGRHDLVKIVMRDDRWAAAAF